MRKIVLTQGKFSMVDDEDFTRLNQYKWYAGKNGNTFYAQKRNVISGKTEYMHKFIISTSGKNEVDHIDGDGLNNQKSNLSEVSHRKNLQNRHNKKQKTSKYVGVCWHPPRNCWIVHTQIEGKIHYIGCFKDEDDAGKAYANFIDRLDKIYIPVGFKLLFNI